MLSKLLASLPWIGCAVELLTRTATKPNHCLLFRISVFEWSRLSEKPWGEIVQAAAPRQPFMGGTRRLEVDVLYPRLRQFLAEVLRARPFRRADAEEQYPHLLIKGRWIGERAVASGLWIESSPAATAASAESAERGEFIEIE